MDKKPGHLTKAKGVLKAISLHADLSIQKIPITWKPSCFRNIIPRLPFSSVKFCIHNTTIEPFDLLISAGGATEWANAILTKKHNAKNIYLGSNRVCHINNFTILPRVIPSENSRVYPLEFLPSEFDHDMAAQAAHSELSHFTNRYWTILIGGNGSGYHWTLNDHEHCAQKIAKQAQAAGVKLIVTSSRRTGSAAEQCWEKKLKNSGLLALGLWHTDENKSKHASMAAIMGKAEAIIVTEDSASMIFEAIATGRPVATISPLLVTRQELQENVLTNLTENRRIIRLNQNPEQNLAPPYDNFNRIAPNWHHDLGANILEKLTSS
jgi:mitochondrial fission protein ELM1